ncbi:MAG TPA: flagellin [Bryobacteraceae bacterium]|nr:flagellin [Bryobacteraceae bacterium]
MIRGLNGGTDQFLADLERIQRTTEQAQRQLSSGLRVQQPSDAPDEVSQILQVRAALAQTVQRQQNLSQVKTEVDTSEQALQAAVQVVERASVLAAQGATSTADADARKNLAQEVQSLEQELVGLSRTEVSGRFVFSGDLDRSPAYTWDGGQPNGVDRLQAAPATRQIEDASGTLFTVSHTAQEIFDHRNADNTLAQDNVFAAVHSLTAALNNNDQAAIRTCMDALDKAGAYLNQQLTFYGTVQDRVAAATNQASQIQLQQQSQLSALQDADLTAAILELNQGNTQQQAALTARAQMPRTSLFDFLQ